jgi:putative DNA primase/helicase
MTVYPTYKIRPIVPEDYVTWRVECEYDPKAQCPYWERMLKDSMPNRKTIDIVQEFAGSTLLISRPRELRRALVLTGPSNVGKSQLITVMSGVLCNGNPITVPFDMLENAHGTMPFLRLEPWVLHEAFDQAKWHFSATVKALLSADEININIKNGPMKAHRYRGAIMWATNFPPQFKEASRALEQRLLIIRMHHVFSDKNSTGAAKEAYAKGYSSAAELILDKERPGYLNWALAGLKRLQERGHFEQTEEMLDAKHDMHLQSNLIAAMVEEMVEFDQDMMVSSSDFYAAFTGWWRESRGEYEAIPSPDSCGRHLTALDERVGVDKHELRFNGKRYYAGIRLNEHGLASWDGYRTGRTVGIRGSLNIEDRREDVNKPIPPQWVVKDIIKRVRKAHAQHLHQVSGTRV